LKRPLLDYFRRVLRDTALFGADGAAPTSGRDFFGTDLVVFATDAPLGSSARTIAAVDARDREPVTRRKIMLGNARRLLNRPLGEHRSPLVPTKWGPSSLARTGFPRSRESAGRH
jgi:hypothetical protein